MTIKPMGEEEDPDLHGYKRVPLQQLKPTAFDLLKIETIPQ